MPERKSVNSRTALTLRLSTRARDLILERALLEPAMDAKLRRAASTHSANVVRLALDDLDDIDELHGCVAAVANHTSVRQERALLNAVCEHLAQLLEEHTAKASAPATAQAVRSTCTAKQGQFLAFIYYYTKLHRRAPSEADLQVYFGVSPPAVHGMIVTLERHGFIARKAGQPRSIRLRVKRTDLPDLE
jgi:DNA-binding MarR family transcriptional regulator